MQLVHYLFAKEQIKKCTVVPDDQKILNLESPAIIALRPEVPVEKKVLDTPNYIPAHIESLVAHLIHVKHWRSTIQHLQKLLLPRLLDTLTISVVQTVFLAFVLGVVFEMVRLRDFDLIRVPAFQVRGLIKFNLHLTASHLVIGWVNQG